LLDHLLGQLPALRRERDDPVLRRFAVDGVESGRDDVDAQHEPRAAAVGLVVHFACSKGRRVAVVEEPELELRAQDRGKRPLFAGYCATSTTRPSASPPSSTTSRPRSWNT